MLGGISGAIEAARRAAAEQRRRDSAAARAQAARSRPSPPQRPQGVSQSTRRTAARAQTPAARVRRGVSSPASVPQRPQGVSPSTRRTAARAQAPAVRARRETLSAAQRVGDELQRTIAEINRARPQVRGMSNLSQRDRVLAEIDAATRPPSGGSAEGDGLTETERRLRQEYADTIGGNRPLSTSGPVRLASALDPISRRAEPVINFLDLVSEPFTTPQKVVGNLIAGKVDEAGKNLVSAGYWGEQRFPSQALAEHGLIDPNSASGMLLGLGADVAPSFAIPSFRSAGRARGEQAARETSRNEDIGRVRDERPPVAPNPNRDTRRPSQVAKDNARRRQQRATRIQPGRGPDIITRPGAQRVPQRPIPRRGEAVPPPPRPGAARPMAASASAARGRPGPSPSRPPTGERGQGAAAPTPPRGSTGPASAGVRGGKPVSGNRPPRRPLEDIPYIPTRRAQKATDKLRQRRDEHAQATVRQSTRMQAANAGIRLGKAQSALRAAETAAAQRRGEKPPPASPPKDGDTSSTPPPTTNTSPSTTTSAGRMGASAANLVDAVRPSSGAGKGGRYTVAQARSQARAVIDAARIVLPAKGRLSPENITRARQLLNITEQSIGRKLDSRVGIGRSQSAAYRRLNRAVSRMIALHEAAPPAKGKAGARKRELVDARREVREALRGYRPLAAPIGRVKHAGRSVAATTTKGPTTRQAAAAGRNLEKAQARVAKAEKAMWRGRAKATRDVEGARSGRGPTPNQTQTYNRVFTGSREREWIDANMDYEQAFRAARDSAPIGLNVSAPWNRRGKGVNIPLATMKRSEAFRRWLGTDGKGTPGKGMGKAAGDVLRWYSESFVSRYGPNPVVRQGAVAADDITRAEMSRTARWIEKESKQADLTDAEMKQASAWLENTHKREPSAKVKAYARKMAALTDEQAAVFIRAGGKLRRIGKDGKLDGGLDRQYVYHLLPPEEIDRFLTSALARRTALYGKSPGFTKQRNVLTIADLKKAGFNPIERLDQLTFARAMAHHRAMSDMELSRSVERRFGWKEDGDPPPGWQTIPSQFTDKQTFVPPDIAQSLRNVAATRLAVASGKFARGAERFNRGWKEWALYTTGYDIRNQVGDSVLTFQATVNPLAPLTSLFHGIRQGVRKNAPGSRVGGRSNLSTRQARNVAEAGGLRTAGFVGGEVMRDVNRPGSEGSVTSRAPGGTTSRIPGGGAVKATRRGIFSAREGRESANRSGIYMRELRKGEGATHAARKAKETVYDYRDVGRVVDWARRYPVGAPFLTWTAKNLPRQIELAAKEPAQLSAILAGIESLNQNAPLSMSEEFLPDYVRDRQPVPIPGYGQTVVDLPTASLNRIPVPGSGRGTDVTRQWLNELGVAPKLAVALGLNTNPLTGEQFRGTRPANRVEAEIQNATLGPEAALRRNEDGEQVPVPGVDDRLAFTVGSTLPGVGTAGRVSGSEGRSPLESASSPLLGHSRTPPMTEQRAVSMLRSLDYEVNREMIPDFNRRLKANAPNWKEGDPIPAPLERQYRTILRKIEMAKLLNSFLDGKGG